MALLIITKFSLIIFENGFIISAFQPLRKQTLLNIALKIGKMPDFALILRN